MVKRSPTLSPSAARWRMFVMSTWGLSGMIFVPDEVEPAGLYGIYPTWKPEPKEINSNEYHRSHIALGFSVACGVIMSVPLGFGALAKSISSWSFGA